MRKNSFKKALAAGLMAAMVTTTPLIANAEIVDTIYGPMLCGLSRTETASGDGYFMAITTAYTNQNWAYIQTTMEIQVTATGRTVYQHSNKHLHTAEDANSTSVAPAVMYFSASAAGFTAFSAHEVVGDIAYVKYLCQTY